MIGTYSTFGETRRRRRRLVYWRLVRFFSALAAVAMVGGYGYQVGVSVTQARNEKLEGDLVRFQQSNLDLRDELATTAQRSSQFEAALGELRQRYAAEVPQGEVADLVASIRKQLAAGVEPERLAFLISAAAQAQACDSQPVTKRFMPRTPVTTGPVSFVRFDERITITGTGEPARNDEGLSEAWYDPASPIHLEFQTAGGATASIDGVVPLAHHMVVDGREYRFSIVASASHFVEITAQACAIGGNAANASPGNEPVGVDG
jgi:cell division protein FtsB